VLANVVILAVVPIHSRGSKAAEEIEPLEWLRSVVVRHGFPLQQ
jgi:hypothetical protein